MKAGACREALLRPKPPRATGREALSQDQVDNEPPTRLDRES